MSNKGVFEPSTRYVFWQQEQSRPRHNYILLDTLFIGLWQWQINSCVIVVVIRVVSWFQRLLTAASWWVITTCHGLRGDRPRWTLETPWSTTLLYESPVRTTVWQQPSSNSSFTTTYDQPFIFVASLNVLSQLYVTDFCNGVWNDCDWLAYEFIFVPQDNYQTHRDRFYCTVIFMYLFMNTTAQ